MLERAHRALGGLLVAVALTACGGGGGKDPLDHALDFALEGTFADIDGLAAEFDGESDVVAVDFGDSVLGTNSSVFKKGDALVNDIECGENSCTGQVVVPQVENGVLVGITREEATFTKNGDDVIVESPSHGSLRFKPVTAPPAGEDDDDEGASDGDGELAKDATCPDWWAAMTKKGTWKVTYHHRAGNGEPVPVSGSTTITFKGENEFTVSGDIEYDLGWGGFDHGYIIFTENFLDSGMCRIYPQSLPDDHSMPPWFGFSLSNGKLVLKLSSGDFGAGFDELHLE